MARPLRIALVSFDFVEHCVPMANALADHADVCLLLPEEDVAAAGLEVSSSVDYRPFRRPRLRQPLAQVRLCSELVRKIVGFHPGVVHLQQGHMWFNLALPFLRRYPLVLTVHDPSYHPGDALSMKHPEWITRFGFRQADQIIVHASRLTEQVEATVGRRVAPVHVVPLVKIHAELPPAAAPPTDDATVLFFGRIWPYKGLEYLIRAEPLISADVPEVRIVIAGKGEDLARYRAEMVHPERFVVHNEFVSVTDRAELFANAAVVALPYVEASQSGVVPLAYQFEKPVVATAVGGLPEIVDDGRTGLLVPPRDERALADAIVRLLKDPELRRELGRNGRRKLEEECSPEVVARQTLAVYREALIATRSNGRRP